MDKMMDKEAELNVIQDRIAMLTLDLRAAMQCLSRAKAVTRIEDQRTTTAPQRALFCMGGGARAFHLKRG